MKGERGFLGMKGEQGNPGSAGKEDELSNVRGICSMNHVHDLWFYMPVRTKWQTVVFPASLVWKLQFFFNFIIQQASENYI
jgi:hypothetical protein